MIELVLLRCVNFMIPLLILIDGFHFTFFVNPKMKYKDYHFGLANKSEETWLFAQKYVGKLCFKWVAVATPVIALFLFFIRAESLDVLGPATAVLVTLQLLSYLLMMFLLPNRAIKKYFDDDGKRKEE